MANTANFDKDLAFRQQQLAQQAAEANALSAYRLYRTQLIERGMMAIEADKAAREMALQVAQTAYQQQMGRVQAVLNAPRGPADWAAYANRLRGLQQSGELPGVLGTLALPGRTAPYSNGGQAPPVPLTNTQMADAATLGLSGGTAQAPQLAGPSWATQRLAAQPYQAPTGIPAYYANPTDYSKLPAGAPPAVPTNLPPGYALAPQTQAAAGSLSAQAAMAQAQQAGRLSAQVMPSSYAQGQQAMSAADLFSQQPQSPDQWYSSMLGQMAGDPQFNQPQDQTMAYDEQGYPVQGSTMTRRELHRARRLGTLPQAQPVQGMAVSTQPFDSRPTYAPAASPYGAQATPAADLFGQAVAPQAASDPTYGGPVAADPNQRGLYGSDVSYQRFRNLSPTEQEMVTGYAQEGTGGFEPQSKEDFLSGMVKAAPNYAPSRVGHWAGMR